MASAWQQIPQIAGSKVQAHSSTIAIEQLTLQLFAFRWSPEHHGPRVSISIPDLWANVQKIVWPIQGDISWPPALALDDEGLKVFALRWRAAGVAS